MVTTVVASLGISTSLMVVTLTNALALVTADTLGVLSPEIDHHRCLPSSWSSAYYAEVGLSGGVQSRCNRAA